MKALNCPQCGAKLEEISERQKFVKCCYCHSRIILPKDNFLDYSGENRKNAKPENSQIIKKDGVMIWNSPFSVIPHNPEINRFVTPYTNPNKDNPNKTAIFLIIAFGAILIAAMFLALGEKAGKGDTNNPKAKYNYLSPN